MVDIALSSGWLFAEDIDTITQQRAFFDVVDGVEFSVILTDRFETYDSAIDTQYTSFHVAPEESHIKQISNLVDIHEPSVAVLHPDSATDFLIAEFVDSGIPVGIENMDVRKESGYSVTEIEGILTKHDVPFVLDVQHAFEHDSSMEYAWDLVEMAGNRLVELHVSGETEDKIHSLVHQADNREAILSFLSKFYETRDVPMVIEGKYTTIDEVQKEVNTLRDVQ